MVNGSGIFFGPGSQVNVGGIIASTADITNTNFANNKFIFDQVSNRGGEIVNFGTIKAADYGLVAFLGDGVANNGKIVANLGTVVLASGGKFTLNFNGDQLINFTIDQAGKHSRITNNGSIIAEAGSVFISAEAAKCVLDNVIDMNGVVIANSVSQQNGEIILSANGAINVNGKLIAEGKTAGSQGGTIQIIGDDVTIAGHLKTAALGDGSTGGAININGTRIDIEENAILNANANGLGATGGLIALGNSMTKYIDVDHRSVLEATGIGDGSTGGQISLYANRINVGGQLNVAANGVGATGGLILLGSDPNQPGAQMTNTIHVDRRSVLNATANGDGSTGGSITLYAMNTRLNGKLDVSATGSGSSSGGQAQVLGNHIRLGSRSQIDATGDSQGGNVFIGGGLHGTGTQPNADTLTMKRGSFINASATGSGMGGEVVLWSNTKTTFKGNIEAKGGPQGGNGGLVEVASPGTLKLKGIVDVSAPNGQPGSVINN